MGWLMEKVRKLVGAVLFLVVIVVLIVVGAFALHAFGVIEDPMSYIEKIRAIDWKAQMGTLLGAIVFAFFLFEILDGDRGYYPRGGVRHGNQVTYEDRNRNGIPDEFERR